MFVFFTTTATLVPSTLSLHDALPICAWRAGDDERDHHPHRRRIAACGRHPAVPLVGAAVTREQPQLRRSVFGARRSEEHTSELQSQSNLVCRLLLEKKNLNYRV